MDPEIYYCSKCGHERRWALSAAWPGPCSECYGTCFQNTPPRPHPLSYAALDVMGMKFPPLAPLADAMEQVAEIFSDEAVQRALDDVTHGRMTTYDTDQAFLDSLTPE